MEKEFKVKQAGEKCVVGCENCAQLAGDEIFARVCTSINAVFNSISESNLSF
jgi:hypothetical protein